MTASTWFILFLIGAGVLFYRRAALSVWTISAIVGLVLFSYFTSSSLAIVIIWWAIFFAIAIPLNVKPLRQHWFTQHALAIYRKVMPAMSRTEREALESGTVAWEGELFAGAPDWNKLLAIAPVKLSAEEQAFLDGPVEELCRMINDWDITHNRADLPQEMWQFLKKNGFFAMIIPKQYGGKEFSAYAHSQVLIKIASMSLTVAVTVSVPNSLGPGELLLHYGTEEQKNYYLPRLARGEEIPCFALTSADAGSDASAMPDHGIICKGEFGGKEVLGMRVTWSKRYITLAPVATVLGLAFKLFDPNHLLGQQTDLGITCALIPVSTPGVEIGRRHWPLNTPFQNGPTHGKDVFIPLEYIIGGVDMVGNGWRMLMECLAAGRAISLPSITTGGAKTAGLACGAYSRVRKQFGVAIGKFEGVQEVLARIASNILVMDATRVFTATIISHGAKPAVASAISKYHVTERARHVVNDAMDIHGGKGICMGPRNYLANGYQSTPISITVEGANILTRCMIIFGQGAMRCHPYVLEELRAAQETDPKLSLQKFDRALFAHIGFMLSNIFRSIFMAVTGSYTVMAPQGLAKRYYQQLTRYSSAFVFLTDVSMFVLGGELKRRESLSARLGDILSLLYLGSAVLKRFHDNGSPAEDFPIVRWTMEDIIFNLQTRFDEIMSNFPNRWVGLALRAVIFPVGRWAKRPSDRLSYQVADLMITPSATRTRLAEGGYITVSEHNTVGKLENVLIKIIACESIERRLDKAVKEKIVSGITFEEQIASAIVHEVLNKQEAKQLVEAHAARAEIIAVDDFDPSELIRVGQLAASNSSQSSQRVKDIA